MKQRGRNDGEAYSETTPAYDCEFAAARWGEADENGDATLVLTIGSEEHCCTKGSERYNAALWYAEQGVLDINSDTCNPATPPAAPS